MSLILTTIVSFLVSLTTCLVCFRISKIKTTEKTFKKVEPLLESEPKEKNFYEKDSNVPIKDYTFDNYFTDDPTFIKKMKSMLDFADFILANGYKEQFYSKTFTVLQIDEYKYWSMDFPTVNTNLINRTFIDDERKAKIIKFVQTPAFKHVYKMSLKDVEDQMNYGGRK